MEYILEKNIDRSWDLVPTSGPFSGQVIANAEGVNLAGVRFENRKMVGVLKATWGLSIHVDAIHTHPDTLRSLCLGKLFDTDLNITASMDWEGFKSTRTQRLLKGAKRVMLFGQAIYTKGAF